MFSRGFLPDQDPLITLPEPFAVWQTTAADLRQLALTDYLRPTLASLPPFPLEALTTERQQCRAAVMLCYMATHYVLGRDGTYAERLPTTIAVPLVAVTRHLGVPPILSYAIQSMYNWRRIDPTGPVAAGNLVLLQNFWGGLDEEWFVTIHITIEATAGRALRQLRPLQTAVATHDHAAIAHGLHEIAATLDEMRHWLGRMEERCDPHIYYHRVRPFMFGWQDNPAMPHGLIYEGVAEFWGRPQQFRGETGAQSGIIPALDAVLGVAHELDPMRRYLLEMRDYMPPAHRDFVAELEAGPRLRDYVRPHAALRTAYNTAVDALQTFRALHIEYAARYIIKPAQGASAGEVGTGGTPFTVYLKKHIRETAVQRLED